MEISNQVRAHAIEVRRLSGVVENDISAIENAYRGHLLSGGGVYLEDFDRLKDIFSKIAKT